MMARQWVGKMDQVMVHEMDGSTAPKTDLLLVCAKGGRKE